MATGKVAGSIAHQYTICLSMGALEDIKDILRGALASLGGFGGRVIARLTLMVVAGHLYGAMSLGLLGQVAAITEILAAIAVLGLKRSLLDLLSAKGAEEDAARITKEALISSLCLAAVMSFALGAAWPFIFPDTDMPPLLYAAIPCIVFAEVAGTAIRFCRIIRWEVIARCIFEPWLFLFAASILYWLDFSETGLLIAYAVSAVGAAIGIGIGLQRAYGFKTLSQASVRLPALYQIPIKSFPVGITDIGVMMFRRLDILVLSLVAGHQVTGIYYMAQQIVTVPHKIHQLFEPMMSPVLAKLHHHENHKVTATKLAGFCRWVFTLQLALTVPFVLFSSELMGLFGSQFLVGGLVLVFLLSAELLDGSFALTETALVFAKPSVPPRLIVVALFIEIVAIYVFAGIWGAEGAAVGFMLSMMSLAVARLNRLQKYLDIRILNKAFFIPLFFAVSIGGILFLLRQVADMQDKLVFGPVILASVVVFLGLVKFFALTSEDKSILQQLRSG